MKNTQKDSLDKSLTQTSIKETDKEKSIPQKGPLSFFSGAVTSALFAWLSYRLSAAVVIYFSIHSPEFSSPLAQSVASGFKTLIIGICFLSTFTFAFIGFGLLAVLIRSLFNASSLKND